MEHRVGEIVLAVVAEGVDVPDLLPRLHHVLGVRVVILHGPSLTGAGVGIQTAFALTKDILQVCQGDRVPLLALCGAVLGDEGVGAAGHAGRIGVDDLIVVAVCTGKVIGNALLRVGDALAQRLADGERDVADVRRDGGIVVEDRPTGIAAAGQPAEN